MSRRKKAHVKRTRASGPRPAGRPAPAVSAAASHPALARRDLRPYIYLGLNQLFVIVYAYLLAAVIPNRHASAVVHLWALPVLMQAMALGMAATLIRAPAVRRAGWWAATVGASLLLAATIVLILRVVVSAAFLAGVYGAFGKAAALAGLIGVALVVELVAIVPLFQLKYLMTRAGRRAYDRLP
jgi:hypothetical protein